MFTFGLIVFVIGILELIYGIIKKKEYAKVEDGPDPMGPSRHLRLLGTWATIVAGLATMAVFFPWCN